MIFPKSRASSYHPLVRRIERHVFQSLGVLAELAAKDSADADATAKRAAEKIEDIVSKLPDDETRATEVPKAIEDAKQAIKAAHSYGRWLIQETNINRILRCLQ
ncbi:laminin subunit alpha [Trichonephila inaurata madagascariensis]|uniref:Laminin subunit alpha n=1 Tax=Trichonephila inaurata madagascariensis TaxID=2747483 RepID=A0A8X6WSI2_9ARAC|nr:laminin subunit alpha [Trichonephila inaurata madagascariensis]